MKPLIVGSPVAMMKEPCLEHPDYFPPKRRSLDRVQRLKGVGLVHIGEYIDEEMKRLEDSLKEQEQ